MEGDEIPILLFINSGSGGGVGKNLIEQQVRFIQFRLIISLLIFRDLSMEFFFTI